MQATLLLALTAGMLGAVNPCGFALLPAYLSVLVAGEESDGPRATVAAVGRALRCTAALTAGYVAVFGTFGLLLAPLTGWLMPRLPWLTVVFGLGLVALGGWLLAGRSLPSPGKGLRAPRLTGSAASMVLFGMAYAVASLGCAIGPFLAIVVSSLRAGSIGEGVALFVSYAAGMGLVIGVTALAVALVRVSAVAKLRRAAAFVPRIGGAVLVLAGAYVAYYGWYELRLVKDLRTSGQDPVVNLAADLQRELSGVVGRLGAGWFVLLLAVLVLAALLLSRRRRTSVGS
ncbi:cytochrome c biogenesis CcdA family protein [Actinoplanes friuliensis]|uniref:Cytochrome c biogenesis protein transmembrane region n=1 Tax=Actinoplanes friuliensis DSM 7358 TaxID=1246995 RepID=U5W3C4_9ACTN|nr:cytochrome c biogenesis CcdA family protein [Actinoplanes friuliensis]AGZ43708.1 cytochrome c biogenesis protein transmembrane region [Actinoplanes friuliensis DSM 7358]